MSDLRAVVAALPLAPGVYRFRDAAGRVLYLGRARELRRRVRSYWGDVSNRPGLGAMVRRIAAIEAAVCDSEHEAAWLERNLLQTSKPRWNRIEGGTEVVAFIRLDDRAGLRFVHSIDDGAPHFGPYLGGLQTRLAISALNRVLPLSYVVGHPSRSGSAAEFAALHGVGPDDRDALMATTASVLDRDPGAVARVRAELVRRRDCAADEQRYESAATLQRELEALDWITADQKVTVPGGADADVAGWADGVLVRFGIRAGTLCTWKQTLASEATARAHVARTPPEWRDFARRNADLAAQLLAAGSDAQRPAAQDL